MITKWFEGSPEDHVNPYHPMTQDCCYLLQFATGDRYAVAVCRPEGLTDYDSGQVISDKPVRFCGIEPPPYQRFAVNHTFDEDNVVQHHENSLERVEERLSNLKYIQVVSKVSYGEQCSNNCIMEPDEWEIKDGNLQELLLKNVKKLFVSFDGVYPTSPTFNEDLHYTTRTQIKDGKKINTSLHLHNFSRLEKLSIFEMSMKLTD